VYDLLGPNNLTMMQFLFANFGQQAAPLRDALQGAEPVTFFAVADHVIEALQNVLSVNEMVTLVPSAIGRHVVGGVRSRHQNDAVAF
jgi:hypothetical protein